MTNITKQHIIEAIRRTAKINGGIPLGVDRFQKETGINQYACHKFWPNFSEALREAGFKPNAFQAAHDIEFLIESVVALMREIGRFPTDADLVGKRSRDSQFPSPGSVNKLGRKKERAEKIFEYAKQKKYDDVAALCGKVVENFKEDENSDDSSSSQILGEVYLCKSGRFYKIGKTNNLVRRGKELRIQLPERIDLIHSIKTVDPSGVETYWHKRFEAKRKQGEWFELTSTDIKEFKRWRQIA